MLAPEPELAEPLDAPVPDDDVPVLELPDELELLVVLLVGTGQRRGHRARREQAGDADGGGRGVQPAPAALPLRDGPRDMPRRPVAARCSVTVVPAVHNRSVASLVVGVVEIASQQTMSFP